MVITVNYIVRNSEKYIRYFLNSLKNQTYPAQSNPADRQQKGQTLSGAGKYFKVNVWDNNSTDSTREIVKNEYPEFNLLESPDNIGVWAAFEKLVNEDDSKYIICLTDVILKEDFIEKAVNIMEQNPNSGSLQAKIYQMELYNSGQPVKTRIIDTCGFKIFKSRKIINLGQGEEDKGQYDSLKEIFAVEGAVPIFRKESLEDCRINGHFIDPDYRTGALGYGDDLDLAWRMRLFGWKQLFSPEVIAYHDRSTTKGFSKNLKNHLARVKERQKIDIAKRRLDWRNTRFTIIKNDYTINILKDLAYIIPREIGVLGYTILFEPAVLKEFGNFIKYLPRMLKRREGIIRRAKLTHGELRKWFQ